MIDECVVVAHLVSKVEVEVKQKQEKERKGMKPSLPPLAPNTSHKKGHSNKAPHKTPSTSNKPFIAGDKVGRSQPAVRKGSYLDDDSVESHKSSFYFEPSIASSSAAALRQPTPPSIQKPSFSPHPPSNRRPPAKKEDPIKKLYEDLRKAGRQRPVSSGMLNNTQPVASFTSYFVEPKVTIEIASKEELAARDLAESSQPSIPTKVEEEGNLPQQESQANSPDNKNLEPQTDPEVACGMIKEGNL